MPRAGERNLAKEQHWRQIIADQQASGLGVAAYCREKGIRVSQFYDRQRVIRERDAKAPATSRQRMAERAKRIAEKAKQEKVRAVEFAEVQIVDRPRSGTADLPADTSALEVVFASGTKVRLAAGCSLELFASVVNLLENR
jgi:hypothetical protein